MKYLLLLLIPFLAGCAKTFEADVARFHRLSPPADQTFQIIAIDPVKQGSLEFEQYASLVRAELIDEGYRPVENDPDLRVELDWLMSEGREKVYSRPGYYSGYPYYYSSFFHPHGFHRFHHPYGFYGAFGYPAYSGSRVYSVTVHSVRLTLAMVDNQNQVRFEGRADTVTSSQSLPEIMPYLVQAMFTNFPGRSGQTQTVELKLPKGKDLGY